MRKHTTITSTAKLAAAVILSAASLLFTGCFYVPGVSGANARAGLVLPRYIAVNTTSLALIVGGPGMNPIYASYTTIPPSISIEVPSGLARTFTVLLNSPSATLQGVSTVDLQPGETRDITLNPKVAGTQIFVPDNYNNRFVQISDMTGTGWTVLPATSPYDVDFDDQGRIYVAYANYAGGVGIGRINDITETSLIPLAGVSSTSQMRSIAMDRARGLLYYTDGITLWRMQVMTQPPGPEETVLLNTITVPPTGSVYMSGVTGIAVDSEGFVYVANRSSSLPAATILKINPDPVSSPTLVAHSSFTFSDPWDVLVKGDFIYVSDYGALEIVRLSKNLDFVDAVSGNGSDSFLGPERFVAILNKPITVIDENTGSTRLDRLVSFNDMTGAGWTTYGSTSGSAQDHFMFFYC